VGTHTRTFALGSQVALPGAGAIEVETDYYLLVVADPADAILEADGDAFGEDNTAVFTGVYHPASGPVFAHGIPAGDTLVLSGGSTPALSFNGTAYSYSTGAVSAWRIRSHAGDDTLTGTTVLPVLAWGGADDDLLTGGTGNDVLAGGAGDD
jgi:Ca2+-binding RTX toxin-like protein